MTQFPVTWGEWTQRWSGWHLRAAPILRAPDDRRNPVVRSSLFLPRKDVCRNRLFRLFCNHLLPFRFIEQFQETCSNSSVRFLEHTLQTDIQTLLFSFTFDFSLATPNIFWLLIIYSKMIMRNLTSLENLVITRLAKRSHCFK